MTRHPRYLVLLLLAGGCGITDAPPPDPDRYINLTVVAGAGQVGLPGSTLSDPIEVRLRSTVTKDPITGREVRFSASPSSGIVLTPTVAITDNNGIARTQARLGSAVGRHDIEVTFTGNPGLPTKVTLEAAQIPVIAQVTPSPATAAGVIVITGENFSTILDQNEVQIDGGRALVTAATATRLEARVPACLPSRAATLTVRRGSLLSAPVALNVTAAAGQSITPARGQAIAVAGPTAVGCVRIGAQASQAEYLVVVQQTANTGTASVPLRVVGLRDGGAPATQLAIKPDVMQEATAPAASFKASLREREAGILRRMKPRSDAVQPFAVASVPEVGERREFRVFVPRTPAAVITAVVRAVGQSLVIYEDLEAAGSIPQSELERLLVELDNPVFTTDLAVFGGVPDLDRNQRVALLLTPAVNRLTKADETSFIAGYFDPCDMVDVNECSDTNRAEILYSMVPDPTGRWGLKHPVERVIQLLPPLAAHELAHLIHFNQRILISGVRTQEELWLSEAIAHFAEDTVAGVLRARGRTADADIFARQNFVRASNFLAAPEKTSLIASTGLATIEERGAGWLFLKYLYNRVGGTLLRRLETSSEAGARNVTATTGLSWAALLRDWSVALFAAGSPEMAGVTLAPEYTFGSFDLRATVGTVSTQGFTLKPGDLGAGDFSVDQSMAPSATSFARLTVSAGAGVNLIVAGDRGGELAATAQPQVTIFRIR